MAHILDNIFWHALNGHHAHFSTGTAHARRYAPGFSPISAFPDPANPDFAALAPFCAPAESLYCADWSGSVGVGDSESDIPMLSTVERPIAFNPTRNLYEHAVEHAWPVVVERKNMIYKLEPHDGVYRLKT